MQASRRARCLRTRRRAARPRCRRRVCWAPPSTWCTHGGRRPGRPAREDVMARREQNLIILCDGTILTRKTQKMIAYWEAAEPFPGSRRCRRCPPMLTRRQLAVASELQGIWCCPSCGGVNAASVRPRALASARAPAPPRVFPHAHPHLCPPRARQP